MNKKGPILVIEDDIDDQQMLAEIFRQLAFRNEIIFFESGIEALKFLRDEEVRPFLILSDVNMPRMNGLELRQMILDDERISAKCIPYLFISTSANKELVVDSYRMSTQGFFMKPNSFSHAKSTIRKIVEYWQECHSPNQFQLAGF